MGNDKEIRVAIYIDGSNLYHKLKDLKIERTTEFDYFGLCNLLARKRVIVSYRYYVGAVRAKVGDSLSQSKRYGQQRLFNHLENQGFRVKQGYLMENGEIFHEKGVDVKIAVDLLVGAYDDLYDVAILISSDTDLIPAIKKVRHLGKELEYVGFSHLPSFALQKNATLSRLLLKDDLEEFIKKD
ncbi:MAG: NYN domain-containing protein [Patescibacteria group bacterium]